MIDGRQLAALATRQWALHRIKLLMQRLAELVTPAPPVVLVITRRDKAEIDPTTLDDLQSEGKARGMTVTALHIASFADEGGIDPGTGISALMLASIQPPPDEHLFWPDSELLGDKKRVMWAFRAERAV
jgi:hypothetical protein